MTSERYNGSKTWEPETTEEKEGAEDVAALNALQERAISGDVNALVALKVLEGSNNRS
jgi:hypothetical protein